MGIRAVILTNAAGGINLSYSQGALVLIRDHINLQGANPLVGPNDDRFGVRFPDMTHAYAKTYRQIAREEAAKLGITLHEGVYAGLLGPSYETPAEIEYLRRIGADLVGMSTVAEVIAARHMGIKVLAISCVTNMAAGILDQPLSHAEVMETGERVKTTFEALLRAVLPRIAGRSRALSSCHAERSACSGSLSSIPKHALQRVPQRRSLADHRSAPPRSACTARYSSLRPRNQQRRRRLHSIRRRKTILIHRQRQMPPRIDIQQRLPQPAHR